MESKVPRHIHRVGVSRRELLQVGFLGAFGMWMSEPEAQAALEVSPEGLDELIASGLLLAFDMSGLRWIRAADVKPAPHMCSYRG